MINAIRFMFTTILHVVFIPSNIVAYSITYSTFSFNSIFTIRHSVRSVTSLSPTIYYSLSERFIRISLCEFPPTKFVSFFKLFLSPIKEKHCVIYVKLIYVFVIFYLQTQSINYVIYALNCI